MCDTQCWMHVNSRKMERVWRHVDVRTTEIVSMVRRQTLRETSIATVHQGSVEHTANKVRLQTYPLSMLKTSMEV